MQIITTNTVVEKWFTIKACHLNSSFIISEIAELLVL